MKFTVISHACLYVEHEEIKLLIDPWVLGSCYWRSWWNYPEVDDELLDSLEPTHIYISHLHWDHYHGPSLRLFEKYDPLILLPKHFNNRMKGDFKKFFKFSNIFEISHGKKYKIDTDFHITSYQFNPIIIDSSIVIEADSTTLLNSNDCKTFGLSLSQITNNHPNIDFVFRSHSSASPIPQCINGIEVLKSGRTQKDYAQEFIAFAKATKSKYSIPFASSHVYLHELSRKFNKYYANPLFIKEYFDENIKNDQQCVVMPSKSSWSKESGFDIHFNNYRNIKNHINEYSKKQEYKLLNQKNLERMTFLNKKAFTNYYSLFLKSLIFPINILNFRFAFLINEYKTTKEYLCIIDGIKKETEIKILNDFNDIYKFNLSFVVKTPVYVFNDCNFKKMHNSFMASKLLEIFITSKNGQSNLKIYLKLVDLYENDCLPIFKLFSFKNIIIIVRRWREILDTFLYLYRINFQKKKIYMLYSKL